MPKRSTKIIVILAALALSGLVLTAAPKDIPVT